MVEVLPDVAGLDRTFHYLVPEALAARVTVGTIVRIPLHGRRVGGWVVAVGGTPPAGVALRSLTGVTGTGPPADVVALSAWAAWRWAGRRAAFLRAASPPRAVRDLPTTPAGRDRGGPVALAGEALAGEALAAGRAVVRLPPAGDPFPYVVAAVDRGAALVLTPSPAGSARLAARLRRGGRAVAVVPEAWAAAAAGGTTVVGARSGAWAPAPSLGAVVVVDAHDEAYREQRAPTWDAWQVAAERARRAGVPCVLVSPCPTLEQLAWGELVVPSRAAERAGWPPVEVVDRRGDDPRSGLYGERLVRLVRGGGRVACVLNRRGRARLLSCAACRDLVRCEPCGRALEEVAGGLRCRACGSVRPAVCGSCGSQALKALRVGVTRVREELEALSGRPVAEVTSDSAQVPDTDVLVGTEALLRRLARADAVAFLDFDQHVLAPRFRAGEQALALLARAARLVGGRTGGGRVLVQTRVPDHEVLVAAVHADPGRLAAAELSRRAALRLPPCAALALVSGDQGPAFAAAIPPSVEVVAAGDGRWLARAPDHPTLCTALASTPRPAGRLRLEVDPTGH